MSMISSFWKYNFKIATSPVSFSGHCLAYEGMKGDVHLMGLDAIVSKVVGVMTLLPAIALTVAMLPVAFGISLLGTIVLGLCGLLASAGSCISDSVDNTYSASY